MSSAGRAGFTTRSATAWWMSLLDTSSSCWVLTTTVWIRTGRPSSYSTVTWAFPSGRSQGISPLLRLSARRRVRRWENWMAAGMSSSVSSEAYPNIIPWSPAPPLSTPMAMSGDWLSSEVTTAHVMASMP